MASNPSLGHFVWYDLMTQDLARAKSFYSELLGLEFQQMDMGPTPYSMLLAEGEPFGGIVDLAASEETAGIPSHWMCYIEVEDATKAAARCKDLGGTVLKEPLEIPGFGSFAVLQDPTGGTWSAWASLEPKPPRTWDQMKTGMVCWNELVTNDVDAARNFYREMHGWKEDEMSMGEGGTYYVQKAGDTGLGGIMQVPMEGIPTTWCSYFLVPKVDEWNTRGLDLGGAQLQPPTDIPDVGRFSVLSDPTGAVFALWENAESAKEC